MPSGLAFAASAKVNSELGSVPWFPAAHVAAGSSWQQLRAKLMQSRMCVLPVMMEARVGEQTPAAA